MFLVIAAFSGSRDGEIRVWNLEDGECVRTFEVSAANSSVCTAATLVEQEQEAGRVVQWSKQQPSPTPPFTPPSLPPPPSFPLCTYPASHNKGIDEGVNALAVFGHDSNSDRLLASACDDGVVRLWGLAVQ